jgi:Baseplate J-like protein
VKYVCCDERRLQAVKEAGALNGIEYVEVSDSEAPPHPTEDLRQRTLYVRLLKSAVGLSKVNVTIDGGERLPSVDVEWAEPASALPPGESPMLVAGLHEPEMTLLVRTASSGDFSQYTLRLVAGSGSEIPPAGFDPLLARVDFSFKVECPSDFDCGPACDCPIEKVDPLAIDYLAKDFGSFRSLMLDRLSVLAPGWTERATADVGVALVEMLAYVADELSYRQDAVGTEAYLGTARTRTSLRRHGRLVDYQIDDGCNARAWVRVQVSADGVVLDRGTTLLSRIADVAPVLVPGTPDHATALAASSETFETVEEATLYASHERFEFWTWGDAGCCLPKGATSATLVGDHPTLRAGQVLVLVEVASPTNGQPEDADPNKRVAVRLTSVVSSVDPSGGLFASPPSSSPVAVTEIAWDEEDALRFPLCISVEEHAGLVVSEAWGNMVLADHGRTVAESLGSAPAPVLAYAAQPECDPCEDEITSSVPPRFRPTLARAPLTHARGSSAQAAEGQLTSSLAAALAALDFSALEPWLRDRGFVFRAGPGVVRGGDDTWSVSDGETVALLRADGATLRIFGRPSSALGTILAEPRSARPAIELTGTRLGATEPWHPQADLLGSDGFAAKFVVEVEHDGSATLRFGDGKHGRRPEMDTSFEATYRVGNGSAGNVGAGALAHVVSSDASVLGATNPLPAAGGADPESAEAIRRDAPEAFLVQERAVTPDDYARITERSTRVQKAAASFRWTGSWHTVFVTADRVGGVAVDEVFETGIRRHLEQFRMAGYDLEIDGPRVVPLDVELLVCVEPEYFRAHVKAAVLNVLSSRVRADGTPGFFHPDRFTFGQPVYLSAVVAAAQEVTGVESVTVLRFQRQRDDSSNALATGVLPMSRLEIARLDNNPSFPERGVLVVQTGGGK